MTDRRMLVLIKRRHSSMQTSLAFSGCAKVYVANHVSIGNELPFNITENTISELAE